MTEHAKQQNLPTWERTINIQRTPVKKLALRNHRTVILESDQGFGFAIVGATKDNPDNLSGVFISRIAKGGVADLSGWIYVGDQLLSVNNESLLQATHLEAIAILQRSGKKLTMDVASNPDGYERYRRVLPDLMDPEIENAKRESLFSSPASVADSGVSVTSSPATSPNYSSNFEKHRRSYSMEDDQFDEEEEIDEDDAAAEEATHRRKLHHVMLHASRVSSDDTEERQCMSLGIKAYNMGQFEKAEKFFLRALRTVVDEELATRLVLASKMKNPKDAQKQCQSLVKDAQDKKAHVHYLLGCSLFRQGKDDEAQVPFISCVKQCLPWYYYDGMEIDPHAAEFHYNIASGLCIQEKYHAARVAFQEAVLIRPSAQWVSDLNLLDKLLGARTRSTEI